MDFLNDLKKALEAANVDITKPSAKRTDIFTKVLKAYSLGYSTTFCELISIIPSSNDIPLALTFYIMYQAIYEQLPDYGKTIIDTYKDPSVIAMVKKRRK